MTSSRIPSVVYWRDWFRNSKLQSGRKHENGQSIRKKKKTNQPISFRCWLCHKEQKEWERVNVLVFFGRERKRGCFGDLFQPFAVLLSTTVGDCKIKARRRLFSLILR